MKNQKTSLLRQDGFQTLLASLVCILGGLIVGYLVLLIIEPSGALNAIFAVMKSFLRYPGILKLKYFGQTLTRTVPHRYPSGQLHARCQGQERSGHLSASPFSADHH